MSFGAFKEESFAGPGAVAVAPTTTKDEFSFNEKEEQNTKQIVDLIRKSIIFSFFVVLHQLFFLILPALFLSN